MLCRYAANIIGVSRPSLLTVYSFSELLIGDVMAQLVLS